MNTEQILKKLKDIQVEAYNNLHSDDKESELQVADKEKVPNEELAGGEAVKIKRPKAEDVKVPDSLSRTTPMAGPTKFNTPEEVYTSGEKKSITIESIQAQLDDLKKNMGDTSGGPDSLIARADSIWSESRQRPMPDKYKNMENELAMLAAELGRKPVNLENLKHALSMFPEGL